MLFTAEYPLLGICNRVQVNMADVSMHHDCSVLLAMLAYQLT